MDPLDLSRLRVELTQKDDAVQDAYFRTLSLARDNTLTRPGGSMSLTAEVQRSLGEMWNRAGSHDVVPRLEAAVLALLELNKFAISQLRGKSATEARGLQLQSLRELKRIELSGNSSIAGPISHALIEFAEATAPGLEGAWEFHHYVENACTYIFDGSLAAPRLEDARAEKLKRVDISYENMASEGFFSWIRHQIPCLFVWVEVKNYKKATKLSNPELDQLAGRLNPSVGLFGILVARTIKDRPTMNRRCSKLLTDNKWTLVLDMEDLRIVGEQGRGGDSEFPHLRTRMRDVISLL